MKGWHQFCAIFTDNITCSILPIIFSNETAALSCLLFDLKTKIGKTFIVQNETAASLGISLEIFRWKRNFFRSWHDAQAIARTYAITCAYEEIGGLGRQWKACPNVKSCVCCCRLCKILNSSSRIHFNWLTEFILNWFS